MDGIPAHELLSVDSLFGIVEHMLKHTNPSTNTHMLFRVYK